MANLAESGFVLADGCDFQFTPRVVLLIGQVQCLDGIVLEVEKRIAILSGKGQNAKVQTQSYRYHGWVKGGNNILRYCSPHPHREYHHKHDYDTFNGGGETGIIRLATEDEVPTMGEVIAELMDWHGENFVQLLGGAPEDPLHWN